MITAKKLRKILHYDPLTGIFCWSAPRPKIKVGDIAGWTKKGRKNYVYIQISGKQYAAHRLAWLYVYGRWPREQIDHINRDKADNRLSNLREATNGQNQVNCGPTKAKSGLRGVVFLKWMKENPWKAQIKHGRVIYLGCFPTKELAHAAYCEAAKRLHGEFFNP